VLGDVSPELKKFSSVTTRGNLGDRALEYFSAVPPEKLTDTEVARQSKALTQIGEIKMDEAKYTEAAAAFEKAYASAATLTARHPQNADMLFERAQAEYWIGFVARRRGDFPTVREWFTRYRDSAVALAAIEGKTLRSQREVIAGHHNLAVLELDLGILTEARTGFLAEQISVDEMLAANSADLSFRFRMADIASWLGSVAEQDGRYADAARYFGEMSSRVEALTELEPTVARWRLEQARSLAFTSTVQAVQGRLNDAADSNERATRLLETLVTEDPGNRQWQIIALNVQLQQIALLLSGGNVRVAAPLLTKIRAKLEPLVHAEPSSHVIAATLATTWRLEGQTRMMAGRDDAGEAVARAVNLGEPLMRDVRAANRVTAEFTQSCLLAGRLALAHSQPESARVHWNRILEMLSPRLVKTNDWRLLDPAAQALVLLGRPNEARPLVERLRRFGYHAVDPLAASTLDAAFSPASSNQNK
jgi:eukaryotic-like serine/threonine-protein kinase